MQADFKQESSIIKSELSEFVKRRRFTHAFRVRHTALIYTLRMPLYLQHRQELLLLHSTFDIRDFQTRGQNGACTFVFYKFKLV